jgi:hypothetical protein
MTSRRPLFRNRRLASLLLVLGSAFSLLPADAAAQTRNVWVNGQRMTDAQVLDLSRRACTSIPDGAYWLNTQTGAWGYWGNPQVQGTFGDACRQPAAANNGGAFRAGPFATMNRANQEAANYRAQGYPAVAFHNGDGYYVDVRR